MRVLFEQHGLTVEQLHKSIRFDAYGPSAPRMIIVGRKARKGARRKGVNRRLVDGHPRSAKYKRARQKAIS